MGLTKGKGNRTMLKDHLVGDLRSQIRENRESRRASFDHQAGTADTEEKPQPQRPSQNEPNPMGERIQQWEEAHKAEPRDLDFDFFCKIIDRVNESSAVKLACNPITKKGDWIPGTPCHNVAKADVDDEGRLVLYARNDGKEMSAEKLYEQVHHLEKKISAGTSPIMMKRSADSEEIQLTDAYSHSLVNEHWAGLPFDVVFAYYDEDTRPEDITDLSDEGTEEASEND